MSTKDVTKVQVYRCNSTENEKAVKHMVQDLYESGWEALMNELFAGNRSFCPETCPGNLRRLPEPNNKHGFTGELTELLVQALYDMMAPFDYSRPYTSDQITRREEDVRAAYLNDAIFYARIERLVAHIIFLRDKWAGPIRPPE